MRRIVLALIVAVLAQGCWDRAEPRDLAYIMSLAVDRAEDGYTISAEVPLLASLGQGGGGQAGERRTMVLTATGATLTQAAEALGRLSPKRLHWGQLQALIVSESVAHEGLGPVVTFLLQQRQVRERTWLFVARGQAAALLEPEVGLVSIPAMGLNGLARFTPFHGATVTHLAWFVADWHADGIDPVSPLLEFDPDGRRRIAGVAAFANDRMVGALPADALRGYLWLTRHRGEAEAISCPNSKGSLVVQPWWIRQRTQIAQGSEVRITVEATVRVLEERCAISEESLSRQVAERARREIDAMLSWVHRAGVDAIGVGQQIHRQRPRDWAVVAPGWPRMLERLPVQVRVDVTIKLVPAGYPFSDREAKP